MRQEGELRVRGYGTTRTRSDVIRLLPRAQEILAFYASRFGPCPYSALGLVLADGQAPGGHSPPGLVYLQRRPLTLSGRLTDDPANFSDLPDFFIAHELAHQWWGQGTAPASYRERWLSEAWAQYCAALWVRERQGEGAFRSMMDRMARWAERHDRAGPIQLGQRLGSLRGDPRIYRAVVYDKGAWVIHMLRGIVGDAAFFAGARAFLQQHRYAKAGSDELCRALEQASGRSLASYFAGWIDDTGLPLVRWRARSEPAGDGFVTTLDVRPESLPGPVPLEVAFSGAPAARRVIVLEPGGGSFRIETRERPGGVSLNDDRGLLARFERVSRLPALPQR
jgi:aminopeptidase N